MYTGNYTNKEEVHNLSKTINLIFRLFKGLLNFLTKIIKGLKICKLRGSNENAKVYY